MESKIISIKLFEDWDLISKEDKKQKTRKQKTKNSKTKNKKQGAKKNPKKPLGSRGNTRTRCLVQYVHINGI